MWPYLDVGTPIRTWALVVTAGVLVCWALFMRRARRLGHDRLRTFLWLLTAFPVGGASAALAAGAVRAASGAPAALGVGSAATGMTVLGAVAGCLLYSVAWARWVLRTSPWALLDAAAFTYPLALAFGRIGCLLNGCCFGHVTDTALGPLTVPLASYAPGTLARTYYTGAPTDALLVNLPLALLAGALVTLVVTERLWRRRAALRLLPGTVLVVALGTDAATRFVAEFLREDPLARLGPSAPSGHALVPGLNPWQTWVGCVLVLCAALLVWLWKRRTPMPTEVAAP